MTQFLNEDSKKNLQIGLEQIFPPNQLPVVRIYHLNIKEKMKYFKTESIHYRFKTSARCVLSHIFWLQTTFPL